MGSEPDSAFAVLTAEDLERYVRLGFVHLPAAFPREVALELQEEIWAEIEGDHGITRDPLSWRALPSTPRRTKRSATNEGVASPRLVGAIGDLLGDPGWSRPADWGGFLVSFPPPAPGGPPPGAEVTNDAWHWDGHPDNGGLMVFTLYSPVSSGGGGTRVLAGSHRLIAGFYETLSPEDHALTHREHRRLFLRGDPWLASLAGLGEVPREGRETAFLDRSHEVRGVPCRVVELLGEPGDAYLCNPGLLHAASRNGSDEPRFGRVKFLRWGGSGLRPR